MKKVLGIKLNKVKHKGSEIKKHFLECPLVLKCITGLYLGLLI